MKKVTFVMKEGNNFGDQILTYFVNGVPEKHTFQEGEWVDPEEYAKILRGDYDKTPKRKSNKRVLSRPVDNKNDK